MYLVAGHTANSSFDFLNFLEFSPQIISIYVWLKLQLQYPQILKTSCIAAGYIHSEWSSRNMLIEGLINQKSDKQS